MIHETAALRGQGRFREAIELVEKSLPMLDPDLHFNAYHEAFLAANELGDKDLTRHYARQVQKFEPGLPSIQQWL